MADEGRTFGWITANASFTVQPPEDPDASVGRFRFVINVIVMGLLSVIGLICNTLAVITLQKDRHKMAMSVLLQGLAISDNLFLVYTLLYSTLRTLILSDDDVGDWKRHLSRQIVAYVLPCGWIAQTSSIWIICAVTADRYLAICHPFKSERYCSLARSKRLLLAVWIVSVVFNVPRFFYYHHMAFRDRDEGSNGGIFVAHADYKDDDWDKYHAVYHIGLTVICLYAVPLPVMVVLNALLVREIASARARQRLMQRGKRNAKDNIRTTLNLVVVVTVFIVCETPDLVASVLRISSIDARLDAVAMSYFMSVKELLLVACAATNFLIYCAFYAKFRDLLNQMFRQTRRTLEYDSGLNSSIRTSFAVDYLNRKTAKSGPTKKGRVRCGIAGR